MEESPNSPSNLTIAETDEFIQVQLAKFIESKGFMDSDLGKIWNFYQIQRKNFRLLKTQLDSLDSLRITVGLANLGGDNVTSLARLMVDAKKSVRKIKILNICQEESFERINDNANSLYQCLEQLFCICEELRVDRQRSERAMSRLSINHERNQQTWNSRSIPELYASSDSMIIQHTDPHLVAEFGAKLLSRRLCPAESAPPNVDAAPSWTKDDSRCVVCLEGFGPEGAFVLGTCGHVYHTPCLAMYSCQTNKCYCSAPLPFEYYFAIGETSRAINDSL